MGKLTYLVIHCTATPRGRLVSAAEILRWHTSPPPAGRGWTKPGYSRVFYLDGQVAVMVGDNGDNWIDANEVTNGVAGINSVSKHIVYVGGMDSINKHPEDTRTPQQKAAMAEYVLQFIAEHPHVLVAAHYHFAAKACPSFNVENWCREIGVPEQNIYKK